MSSMEKTRTFNVRGNRRGEGGEQHTHPDERGGATLPSHHLIAKTNAEGHIQHTNPRNKQEQQKGDNTSYGNGATTDNAGT